MRSLRKCYREIKLADGSMYRCKPGQLYADDPTNKKSDIWCKDCGAWQPPEGFVPMPYVAKLEETRTLEPWEEDEFGFPIDDLDKRVLDHFQRLRSGQQETITHLARVFHCSNGEARSAVERLERRGQVEKVFYGPSDRWMGYTLRESDDSRGRASRSLE
jgi:hypothetical protein